MLSYEQTEKANEYSRIYVRYFGENPDEQIGSCFIEGFHGWHSGIGESDSYTLWSVEIYKEHRGKGEGQKMIQEIIELCDSLDIKKLDLEVYITNQPAIHIYRKNGFKIDRSGWCGGCEISPEKCIEQCGHFSTIHMIVLIGNDSELEKKEC